MCRTSGFYSRIFPPDGRALERMNECIKYRGPDEFGYYQDGALRFAHRCLSTIGGETGRLPIFNEPELASAVLSGGIYYYEKLPQDLSKHLIFTTNTDFKVIIHFYEKYGSSFVERLLGLVTFEVWDALYNLSNPGNRKYVTESSCDSTETISDRLEQMGYFE